MYVRSLFTYISFSWYNPLKMSCGSSSACFSGNSLNKRDDCYDLRLDGVASYTEQASFFITSTELTDVHDITTCTTFS